MLNRLFSRLRPGGVVVRGRPHFIAGLPRGPLGVVAWIPEGRMVVRNGQRRFIPTTIIELHATGVRRRPLRRSPWPILALALAVALFLLCARRLSAKSDF